MSDMPNENTDKELWREPCKTVDDSKYYMPRIFVTQNDGVGIEVGGMVHIKPIREWHELQTKLEKEKAQSDEWASAWCDQRDKILELENKLQEAEAKVKDLDNLLFNSDGMVEKQRVTIANQKALLDRVLGLVRQTKMGHGLCQPRERKACTSCNASEELDSILSEWKGVEIKLQEVK